MASTIANYQGNGSTTDFNVPFDYLAKKFVKVAVDSREKLGGDYGDTTKDYFFVDKTTIRFNTAPASGTEIIIRRYTSATDRIVSFKDASVLKAKDLDASAIQTIHIAEEGRDIINDALIVDKEGNWDARGHRIVNVGDPIGDNDAVSLKFYKDDAMGAYQAKLKAEAARDAAKVSETNAKASEVNAKESEVTAKASAGTAVSAAKHADAAKTENQEILEEARQLQTDIETSESNVYENSVIATQKAAEAKVSEVSASESASLAKNSADASASTLAEVKTEGAKQVKSITDTATSEINKITSEGGKQVTRVTTTGNQQVSAVTAEGTKQVNLAKAQVALAVQEVTKAKEQVSLATQQATLAITKATEAESSATSASQSATVAESSATSASQSATVADTSAKSASASASTATTQATNAGNSAKAAKLSEDNAALSKTAAGTSATNAKASETEAKRQADLAKGYAEDSASGQLNADWAVTDSKSKAFIKNKPTLGTLASKNSIAYTEVTGTPDLSVYALGSTLTAELAKKANLSHTHTIANVTNLQAALDAKASNTDLSSLEVEVTKDLQAVKTALAGKAPSSHTHTSTQITDLSDTLAPYAKTIDVNNGLAGKANKAHTHTVSQITDMPKVVLSVNDITPDDSGNVKVGALPLGHLFAWPFQTPPDGAIQCNGATYNRALYKDFFAYATSKGWVKPESEWQRIASADGGYCPYYSQGDGSTTFRTPKFAPFMQVAIASENVGEYRQAGLPNITGYWNTRGPEILENATGGAFSIERTSEDYGYGHVTGGKSPKLKIDASRSSSLYGRSTTVQPESHGWMICVVVAGQATNLGSVDVSNVMSAVAQVQVDVENIQANMPPRSSAYVKEIWKSDTEWRRIFSDGWIEQGGILKGNSGTVSFHKEFSNTDYTFLHAPNLSDLSGQWFAWEVSSKTTTSIKIHMLGGAHSAPSSMCWVAYGY